MSDLALVARLAKSGVDENTLAELIARLEVNPLVTEIARRRGGLGGRKPLLDWGYVSAWIFALMQRYDEFGPDEPEWNAQARLEQAVARFCEQTFGVSPDIKTIRERIAGPLRYWREFKAAGNEYPAIPADFVRR